MIRPVPDCHKTIGSAVDVMTYDTAMGFILAQRSVPDARPCIGSACSAWLRMMTFGDDQQFGRCGLVKEEAEPWLDPATKVTVDLTPTKQERK